MDCLRELRRRRRMRRSENESEKETYSKSSHRSTQQNSNPPRGVRKFFGSLLSLRSGASSQTFHFENESRREGDRSTNDFQHDNTISLSSSQQEIVEYTRKDTGAVTNDSQNDKIVEDDGGYKMGHSENEVSEIVPYIVAEQRLEDGELEECVMEEEGDGSISGGENDGGDIDIYPYPQPVVSRLIENREKREDSEIEVILSVKHTDDGKSGKGGDDDAVVDSAIRVKQGLGEAATEDVEASEDSDTNTDTESKEIYVSRNIPVELREGELADHISEERKNRNKNSKDRNNNDKESRNAAVASGNSSSESETSNDDSEEDVDTHTDTSRTMETNVDGNKVGEPFGNESKSNDYPAARKAGESPEAESYHVPRIVVDDSEIPITPEKHDDLHVKETHEADKQHVQGEGRNSHSPSSHECLSPIGEDDDETEGLIDKSNISTDDQSDRDQSAHLSNDQSESLDDGESDSSDSDQSESSEDDQSEDSDDNQSESSKETSQPSEPAKKDEGETSIPTASYIKNNIQITIIGEVDDELLDDYYDYEEKDPNEVETNKYRLI